MILASLFFVNFHFRVKCFSSFFGTDYRFTVLNGVHVLVSFLFRDRRIHGVRLERQPITSDGIALKKDIASDIATIWFF